MRICPVCPLGKIRKDKLDIPLKATNLQKKLYQLLTHLYLSDLSGFDRVPRNASK